MIFIFGGEQYTIAMRDLLKDVAASETEAKLYARDGMIVPTPRFLRSLARRLMARGIAGATSSAAWQAWVAVLGESERARAENEESAELAFWYHIDPYGLTEEKRAGLMANLQRVQAQQTIQAGSYNPTDYGFVYDLFFLATGDKERALRERARAMEAFVESASGKG